MVCAKAETFHDTSSLRSNSLKNAPQGLVITGGFVTPPSGPGLWSWSVSIDRSEIISDHKHAYFS